jgi:hypothetical protein
MDDRLFGAHALVADPPAEAGAGGYRRGTVAPPSVDRVEWSFPSPGKRADVEAIPTSARVEPLPDRPRRTATPAEATELRVPVVDLADEPTDAGEGNRIACANRDAALISFRLPANAK